MAGYQNRNRITRPRGSQTEGELRIRGPFAVNEIVMASINQAGDGSLKAPAKMFVHGKWARRKAIRKEPGVEPIAGFELTWRYRDQANSGFAERPLSRRVVLVCVAEVSDPVARRELFQQVPGTNSFAGVERIRGFFIQHKHAETGTCSGGRGQRLQGIDFSPIDPL